MSPSPQLLAVDPYQRLTGQVADTNRVAGQLVRQAGVQGAQSITGDHLTAGSITTATIAAGSITTELLAAGAVIADAIAAGAITTEKLAAEAVIAEKIAASAITTAKLAAGSITAEKIAAGAVIADTIAAGAISAVHISAGAITGDRIAAATITATNIDAATITGALIAAGTITATNIETGALTGDLLAGATITGDKLVAATITADKLSVTSLSAISADLGTVTAGQLRIGTAGGTKVAIGEGISTSSGAKDGIVGTDATNAITFLLDADSGDLQLKGQILTGSSGLGNITGQINGTSQIAPATIAGDRLVAHTITAAQIAAGTITATEIAAATITGGNIAAGTITGAKIAAGTITADKLTVTTLSAISANLGTITAGTITGATFRTGSTHPRVQLDSTGVLKTDVGGDTVITIGPMSGIDILAQGFETPVDERNIRWLHPTTEQPVARDYAVVDEIDDDHTRIISVFDPADPNDVRVQLRLSVDPPSGSVGISVRTDTDDLSQSLTLLSGGRMSDWMLKNEPAVHVAKVVGGNQSIPNAATTKVTFDTAVADTNYEQEGASGAAHFDNANDRVYCRKTGDYELCGTANFAANATGDRAVLLRRFIADTATTEIIRGVQHRATTAGLNTQIQVYHPMVFLEEDDYIEMLVFQNSGAALNLVPSSGSNYTDLMMRRSGRRVFAP